VGSGDPGDRFAWGETVVGGALVHWYQAGENVGLVLRVECLSRFIPSGSQTVVRNKSSRAVLLMRATS
jgi:hypothetical protein